MFLRALSVSMVLLALGSGANAQPLKLILPTANDALLRGEFEQFYQFTDRTFRGVRSHPWQGGQYGFVRNQEETSAGIVYTRFHEGLDIKPVYRNGAGEPLDTVRSVDGGLVVYVNPHERHSSYGKYVVVEHNWSGMPFYSLYAHLGTTRVDAGERVKQGQMLGILGYTGRGIDKRRAHLHFEINMMLSEDFGRWHDAYFRGTNRHGIHNGMNLAGIDAAALFLELHRTPGLTIERFLRTQQEIFRIRVPNEGALDVHHRYPWISAGGYDSAAPSLEISFARSGLPVRIESSWEEVGDPAVVYAAPSPYDYSHLTEGMLSGNYSPRLTNKGRRYLQLLTSGARDPANPALLAGRVLPRAGAAQVEQARPLAPRPTVQVSADVGRDSPSDAVAAPEVVAPLPTDRESIGGEVRGW